MIDIHEMAVLLVDDMVNMTKSIHNMMKVIKFGRNFLFAHTGKEALDILRREPIDLLFLDYNMPEMPGAEVLRVIRDDRKLRDLSVIMVTAEAYNDFVAEVGESEVDAYILKPVTIKLLQEKVSSVVEKAMKISPCQIHRGVDFGKILVQRKMDKRAIQVFNKVLDLHGSSLELREEIADFCIEEGVDGYAVKLLESIVKKLPDRSDLFFKLGKSMERLGDINKAVIYLINASEIDKQKVDIKISLAKNYLTLGKPILAEKPLKDTLKIDPKNEVAKELLRQCA